MRILIMLACVLLSATACSDRVRQDSEPQKQTSSNIAGQIKALQSLASGKPQQDAEKAFAEGNTALWSYHNRARRVVPGVEPEKLPSSVTLQNAPGMSDMVYNEAHQKARRRFLDYAAVYNRTLLGLINRADP